MLRVKPDLVRFRGRLAVPFDNMASNQLSTSHMAQQLALATPLGRVDVFTSFEGIDPCMVLQSRHPGALTSLGVRWQGTMLSAAQLRKHGADRIRYQTSDGKNNYLKSFAGMPVAKLKGPVVLIGQLNCTTKSCQQESFTRLGEFIDMCKPVSVCMDVTAGESGSLPKFRQCLDEKLGSAGYSCNLIQQHTPLCVGIPGNCSNYVFIAVNAGEEGMGKAPGP